MSPTIHRESGFVFYFVSFDVATGEPPHVHVGPGSQQPGRDAKIWLEPEVRLARQGRLRRSELRCDLHIVEAQRAQFLEDWHDYKRNR